MRGSSIPKPFFLKKTILLGVADESRIIVRVPPRGDGAPFSLDKILRKGEETLIESGDVCVTRGFVHSVSLQDPQRISPRDFLYLPEGTRIELGKNDEALLRIYDGTQIRLFPNERFTLHYLDSREKVFDAFKELPRKNHYGFFWAKRGKFWSFAIPSFLHDPQREDDVTAPQVLLRGGAERTIRPFEKLEIDATPTLDDTVIEEVWWDFDPAVDSNKDEDPQNDRDFPKESDRSRYSPRQVLNLSFPGFEKEGNYSFVLHVRDDAGNIASQKISVTVKLPDIFLDEVSERRSKILGHITPGSEGVSLFLYRKMGENSPWEQVLNDPVLTRRGGNYEFDFSQSSGETDIRDRTGKTIVSFSDHSVPKILEKGFSFGVSPATSDGGTRIFIREDKTGTPIASISFSLSHSGDVRFFDDIATIGEGVFVRDTLSDDIFEFRSVESSQIEFSGSVAIVDLSRNITVAMLSSEGNFYILDPQIRFEYAPSPLYPSVFHFDIFSTKQRIGEFIISPGRYLLHEQE